MDDLISRQAAIDAMEQAKEQYFDRRVIIGKMQDIVNNLPSADTDYFEFTERLYKDAYERGKAEAQREYVNGYAKEYTIEQMNQARYIGFIEGKESAHPDASNCWGCNCPKMERLNGQKTFSEMVHLHDTGLPSVQPEQRWIPCLECEKRCDKWEHSKTLQE